MSYYSVKDVIPETIPEEDENKKSLEPAQYGQYDNFRIFPNLRILRSFYGFRLLKK